MTLIEILIVIALFALVATGVSMGIGALHRTKLRSAAMDVAARELRCPRLARQQTAKRDRRRARC